MKWSTLSSAHIVSAAFLTDSTAVHSTLEVYTHMNLAFEMHETALRNITQQCLCAYCISHRIQALYQAINGEGVSETKGMVGRVVTAATQQKGL